MARTPEDLVRMEVHYCVSSLVATVAEGVNYMIERRGEPATELAYQAQELCSPIDDWEEAALQADHDNVLLRDERGWHGAFGTFPTARELCEAEDIEPYQREVFEHWIVSDWLADQLEARGEKVDKDFAGLTVWARTTTGQAIASDSVMKAIAADLNASA